MSIVARRLLVGAFVFGVAIAMTIVWVVSRPDDGPRPTPQSSPEIIALGDSYISGEGAREFEAGTNNVGSNQCRRAPTSYPYLVAKTLGKSVVSLACSGATVRDILAPDPPVSRDGQYGDTPADIVGSEKQMEVFNSYPEPGIVLLSIGGNDIGFSQIVRACIAPGSCLGRTEEYFHRIDKVQQSLRITYDTIHAAAPDSEIYVVTYPMPLATDQCPKALLSFEEFGFVDEFVRRFDDVITSMASLAGMHVVDIEDAFDGHRICDDVRKAEQAMNALWLARPSFADASFPELASAFAANFHNSFHPTPFGHELIAEAVVDEIRTGSPAPDPISPHEGPTEAPPWVPDEIAPPVGPYRFPADSDCDGDQVLQQYSASSTNQDRRVRIPISTLPGSRVCFRAYKQRWHYTEADAEGVATVNVDFHDRHGIPSIHQILFMAPDRSGWLEFLVVRD